MCPSGGPSTIHAVTITNENLEIFSCFRFRDGEANIFPKIFFPNVLSYEHVGHAQATAAGHDYETKILSQRFLFAFAFVIQQTRNHKIRDFYLCSLAIVSMRMVARPLSCVVKARETGTIFFVANCRSYSRTEWCFAKTMSISANSHYVFSKLMLWRGNYVPFATKTLPN